MNANTYQRLELIHDSEKHYRNSLHNTELIYRDEEARLLQLQNLALRDDAAQVNDQLVLRDGRNEDLTRQNDELRLELESHTSLSRSKEAQFIKQTLDLAALRAEVDSLNAAIKDSNKVVEEKFALTRELDRLRPEVQHLQSQVADYQHVATQKHELQRRLDSLEIELRNEKDRKQQSLDRETNALVSELKRKAKEAEEQAAADSEEYESLRLEHEQQLLRSQTLTEKMKEEVMSLKSKLKEAQHELRETKAELETCRSDLQAAQISAEQIQGQVKEQLAKQSQKVKKPALKKPKVVIATQTPGKSESTRPMARKRPVEQALLGGKSDFSVTPFLNRTKGLLDDTIDDASHIEIFEPAPGRQGTSSPAPESNTNGALGHVTIADPPTSKGTATAARPQKPRAKPKTNPVTKLPSAQKTKQAPTTAKRAVPQKPRRLEEVLEEEPFQEEQRSDGGIAASQAGPPRIAAKENPFTINAKKKRKLLGGLNKDIFEEEEDELVPQNIKNPTGPARRLKAPLKGALSSFATTGIFSPLKRDRRGVGASFLV